MYGDELSAVAERTHEQHKSRWCMAGAEHYNNIRANPSLACAHLAISTDLSCHTFGILAAAAADDDATSVATCTSLNEARRCYCDILYGLRTQLIIQSQSEKPQASCRTKNVYGEVTSFAINYRYSIRGD